jgi:hypothetical protein
MFFDYKAVRQYVVHYVHNSGKYSYLPDQLRKVRPFFLYLDLSLDLYRDLGLLVLFHYPLA